MYRMVVRAASSLCAALALLAITQAQTTGGISGRVTDQSGAPVPGVAVEASSVSLQGVRATVTDADGRYNLRLLPPGSYTVKFSVDGYSPATALSVAVALGRDRVLTVELQEAVKDEVTVEGAAAIDTRTTTLGRNYDDQTIEALPKVERTYTSVVATVPGTGSDANPENRGQKTITVYGSSGVENSYYIDGVNTTGVEYGFQGKDLNFDFIEAIEVKTAGYEAEYGRSTGGVISVTTKSGGNEFHGGVFGYYDSDSLQRDAEDTVSLSGTRIGYTRQDFGVDVGGFMVKDKLWFFAGYNPVDHSTDIELPDPQAGVVVESKEERDLGAFKLTWNVSDNNKLVGTYFQDPTDITGALDDPRHSLNGEPSTYLGLRESGGTDYGLRYEGIFGGNMLIVGQASRHEDENSTLPASASGDEIQYLDVANDNFQTGGIGLIEEKEFQRDFLGASMAWLRGTSEIKLGAEYEKQTAEVIKRNSGGQQVFVHPNPTGDPLNPLIYRHAYWTTPDATIDNAPVSQLMASPEHRNTTVYMQAKFQLHPNLNISTGIRWDRQEIIDAAGVSQIELTDLAPRFGLVWDPNGDQRSRLFASYGRYYEQIPMDLVIRSFSYERQPRIINFDPVGVTPDPDAEEDFGTESAILGGFTEPSDPNIEGQYLDEIVLGYERKLRPNWVLGIKGIHREYGQVIEDFLCIDDGTYCIGNPGEGIMERVFTLDYSRTIEAPEPKREFKGVQIDLTKQLSNNWQGIASYIWSELDGNFDGGYAPFTNVGADPNISAAYDYFDFFTDGQNLSRITNNGPLSNDRRHQLKLSGTWFTPVKLELGVSAFFRTGTPLTRYGFSDAYGRYEFFLTERGGEGRNPSNYDVDVHLGYPLKLGKVTLDFSFDIFNLLDTQRPILLDQRWGFEEADNSGSTPANPNYGKAVLRTPATAARVGLRVSF